MWDVGWNTGARGICRKTLDRDTFSSPRPEEQGSGEGLLCGQSVQGTFRGRLHVPPPPVPTYPGGPSAAASSEPAARPRRHWTAGALPPGPGSAVAHLPPGLRVVGTGREDTAKETGNSRSGEPSLTLWILLSCSGNHSVLQLAEQLSLTAQMGKLRPKRMTCLPRALPPPPPRGLQTHGDLLGTVSQHCQGTVRLEHREGRDATLRRRRERVRQIAAGPPSRGLGSSLRAPSRGEGWGLLLQTPLMAETLS